MRLDLTAVLPGPWKPYAKLFYAVLGVGVLLVADGTLHGTAAHIVTAIAGALTPAVVFAAENRVDTGAEEQVAQDTYPAAPGEPGALDDYPDPAPAVQP